MRAIFILLFIAVLTISCTDTENIPIEDTSIFSTVSPNASNIQFSNDLIVNDSINFFNYGYYYMGGGVAVGDLNNDGLPDIYFTGNRTSNKLYLNKGELVFEDITESSGVTADDRWITGVAMSDVNADGWMDIYVSVAGIWTSTKNILYINQGLNDQGIPTFIDEAEQRGVADEALSIQSTFFDYDQDGDIDMYVANYEVTSFGTLIYQYKKLVDNPVLETSDHLYENQGDGTFIDVTESAGMLNFGLAVGVIAADFNNDNLTDIYVSNDFNTPDNFYFNNGDGTFTDLIKETTQHTAFYGMGVDAADVNNDGLMDLVQMDMTPADNFRSKANMASMDIQGFWDNINAGFHHQYMYNPLQINQGIRDSGQPFFADFAKASGIHQTDWSWASLFADFDNDGLNDLFVTNGTRRDINNKDFFKWMKRLDISMKIRFKELTFSDLTEKMPFKKIDNYMFENIDGLKFEKANEKWGIQFEGFSNGASYADLDNDGDLEIIINNIDSVASIFKNNTIEKELGDFVKVKLNGPKTNPLGLGAKVKVNIGDQILLKEQTLVRGYESSVEPILHFGLGKEVAKASIEVVWPDQSISRIKDISNNSLIEIDYASAMQEGKKEQKESKQIWRETKMDEISEYINSENDFDDFAHQILIPHRMSRLGPAVASADINNDNQDDLFIGGAAGIASTLFIKQAPKAYKKISLVPEDSIYEDVNAIFFDADGDGDEDLYVVSGGNDFENQSTKYQDRLYINTNGAFEKSNALPKFTISGFAVLPVDYDQDGDLDLFVGGRQTPRQYPLPVQSFFLENKLEDGSLKFEITSQPNFEELGMVTSAINIDLNQDNIEELVIVGEWMPISIFELEDKKWIENTESYDMENTVGWWNIVDKADFDEDGDEDLIVGNLGLNYKYKATPDKTFDIYANDYDENGNIDIVLGYYEQEKQFPVRGMQCSSEQIPAVSKKFKNKYNAFAEATLTEIYTEEKLDNGIHYQAQTFESLYIQNQEGNKLIVKELPFEIQTSSFNTMVIGDFNGDNNLDIVAGGNQFNSEIETPRNDACFGWMLAGDGQGNFEMIDYDKSGLYIPYDIKQMTLLQSAKDQKLIVVSNSAPIMTFDLVK